MKTSPTEILLGTKWIVKQQIVRPLLQRRNVFIREPHGGKSFYRAHDVVSKGTRLVKAVATFDSLVKIIAKWSIIFLLFLPLSQDRTPSSLAFQDTLMIYDYFRKSMEWYFCKCKIITVVNNGKDFRNIFFQKDTWGDSFAAVSQSRSTRLCVPGNVE